MELQPADPKRRRRKPTRISIFYQKVKFDVLWCLPLVFPTNPVVLVPPTSTPGAVPAVRRSVLTPHLTSGTKELRRSPGRGVKMEEALRLQGLLVGPTYWDGLSRSQRQRGGSCLWLCPLYLRVHGALCPLFPKATPFCSL